MQNWTAIKPAHKRNKRTRKFLNVLINTGAIIRPYPYSDQIHRLSQNCQEFFNQNKKDRRARIEPPVELAIRNRSKKVRCATKASEKSTKAERTPTMRATYTEIAMGDVGATDLQGKSLTKEKLLSCWMPQGRWKLTIWIRLIVKVGRFGAEALPSQPHFQGQSLVGSTSIGRCKIQVVYGTVSGMSRDLFQAAPSCSGGKRKSTHLQYQEQQKCK